MPGYGRVICWVCVLLTGSHVGGSLRAGEVKHDPGADSPRTVEIGASMRALIEAEWVDEDREFAVTHAEARATKNKLGVTTYQDASGGCDGIRTGRCGFHTATNEQDPWWEVDLGADYRLDRVVVYNRTDGTSARRARHLRVLTARDADRRAFREVYRHNGEVFYGAKEGPPLEVELRGENVTARIVRLLVPGRCSFGLDEVEVYGADDPKRNLALRRPANQKSVGRFSYPGTKGYKYVPTTRPTAEGDAFSLDHTAQVIARGRRLADRLRSDANRDRLGPLVSGLDRLERRLTECRSSEPVPKDVRREVYIESRRLLRKIAFCNPRLDLDKILFVKRRDPGGLFHMVHQYYGFGAKPGGGLFVLSDPFGPNPKLVNLLADAVVQNGRLEGRRLVPGAFLSPEVSFDGKTILFAYTEGKAKGVEWSPRSSYHIFRASANGTGLVQLTDGAWNEFDPCFLPNGRIVFISERRGGYLRCGGSSPPYHSPTYTLHSMAADGSDVVCLSFHETHEWHPSVNNDGMIVYTRWDYVDRDTNVAHHIWTCYPDGRDPRAFHGNYPVHRESRPWMEMSIRSIQGSPLYVATAAPHHGHAFGSLVLIDPRVPDDRAMSQVFRLTPEVPFPESECPARAAQAYMIYGTPWPLSEDDYLCVYDRHARNRGIYWLDRFGNRELIYRDPSISCLSPIPLRPRRCPPLVPDQTMQTAAARATAGLDTPEDGPPATIAVMNVYDSDFDWPEGTKIASLRIIQVLPKTTPRVNTPRIGVANGTNARAVLGTVPVEADGSAHFEAPVGKLIYFQALDAHGMAVQSMRSGTYVHPGERLTCQGCHEPKHCARRRSATIPLALGRAPSTIRPDVDGSNPFSFVRLVQPVLDRHCVACHQAKKAVDLTGRVAGSHGWTRSYGNLAGKYGFYFDASKGSIRSAAHGGSRTTPGEFGARASKLLRYMDERHYGVKLPDGDRRRLTLWLDCNSEFYGAYENTGAQARGEVVFPSLN